MQRHELQKLLSEEEELAKVPGLSPAVSLYIKILRTVIMGGEAAESRLVLTEMSSQSHSGWRGNSGGL